MLTAQDIYTAARALSLPERLRLAALILEELDPAPHQVDLATLDGYSDAWTEEDIQDFKRFSARHLNSTEGFSSTEQDEALPPPEGLLKMRSEQSLEPKRT